MATIPHYRLYESAAIRERGHRFFRQGVALHHHSPLSAVDVMAALLTFRQYPWEVVKLYSRCFKVIGPRRWEAEVLEAKFVELGPYAFEVAELSSVRPVLRTMHFGFFGTRPLIDLWVRAVGVPPGWLVGGGSVLELFPFGLYMAVDPATRHGVEGRWARVRVSVPGREAIPLSAYFFVYHPPSELVRRVLVRYVVEEDPFPDAFSAAILAQPLEDYNDDLVEARLAEMQQQMPDASSGSHGSNEPAPGGGVGGIGPAPANDIGPAGSSAGSN